MRSDDGDDDDIPEYKPILLPSKTIHLTELDLPRHTIKTILELSKSKTCGMNVSDIMGTAASSAAVAHISANNGSCSPSQDSNITLWQFLLELLEQKKHMDIIQWIMPREKGEFKLIDAEAVAKLWGQRKGKAKMNYDKLSRALRYYYDKGIIKKVVGQKFVYQFPASASFSAEARTSHDYHHLKVVKEEKDYEMPMNYTKFPIPAALNNGGNSFTALSLMNASSPNATAHSVATPSPSDSACSPSSSSSISSATTSMAPLGVQGTSMSPGPGPSTSSPQQPNAEEPTPSSHSAGEPKIGANHKRKRVDSPLATSSSTASTSSSTPLTTSKMVKAERGEPQPRRMKPNPLNLTATSNFIVPTSTFSPMMLLHQNSPLMQPTFNQLYATFSASLASAGLYGPQMSPLLAAVSPFRSPMNTPGAATSVAQQVFQFPPTSTFPGSSLINPFSSLISPVASFMNPSTTFKFPSSESLKTPTVPLKMPSL